MGVAAVRFASFLADNGFAFYRQVVDCLAKVTGLPAQIVTGLDDQHTAFAAGELDAAFCCGLPYVQAAGSAVALLGAPVMAAPRYGDRPVYFADVIVRRDSAFQTLPDLRGAVFAYNQPQSFSGYVLPRHHLLALNESLVFFSAAVATGSHAASLDWVETGRADCAAIDSVVLEMELRQKPERAHSFRVVASIGPAPMPPVIASSRLPAETFARLREALLNLHTRPEGLAILQAAGLARFASVSDDDYDGIRQRLRELAAAGVESAPAAAA